MRALEFSLAIRTCGTAHLFELAECFEPQRDAAGGPLPFKISDEQTAEARAAIATLRRVVHALDLVPNAAAQAARSRQSAARGKPASLAARGLY